MEEKKPNLILDLDDVILHHPTLKPESYYNIFSEKIFPIKDVFGNTYIVPAYLPEFMKWCHATFNISFFSSGDINRNKSVVQDIWMKAFGVDRPENTIILSRDDLIDAKESMQPVIKQRDGDGFKNRMWFGNKKKDVTKIGSLNNTILVDDDLSWVIRDQIKNYLCVTGSGFYSMTSFITYYREHDQNKYEDKIKEMIFGSRLFDDEKLLPFYKLLYVVGVLDVAMEHINIVEGLYRAQYDNDIPNFLGKTGIDLKPYKIGYKALSDFSGKKLPELFPEIEKYFV